MKITDFIDFNPKRALNKGCLAPFINMAALPVDSRDINQIGEREFKGGGSKFKNGDTLFARITPCLENGKTAKVAELPENTVAHGSTEFIVMAAKEPEYDQDYIYYLARLPEFRSYAQARMEGTSGRQRVPWQSLVEFDFNFPEKEKRKEIGDFLKTIDNKIELNRQTNQTLEQIAQAIFKSWFVDFDPVKAKAQVCASVAEGRIPGSEKNTPLPKDFDVETAIERAAMCAISSKSLEELEQLSSETQQQLKTIAALFPDTLVESELGEIPEGWAVTRFKQIVEKYIDNRGKTPPLVDFGIPLLEVKHLPNGSMKPDLDTTKYVDDETYENWFRAHLETSDIIISTVGTIGRICMVPENEKFTIAQNLLGMRFYKEKSSPYFMYYQMDGFRFRHDVDARLIITVQASIKRKDLETIDLLSPPVELQNKFEEFISPFVSMQQSNQEIKLSNMRDSLLPKLLSGELQIEQNQTGLEEAI
ncbi:MAG: restriction endonuclease subunit S [Gammaproteobacteria bacterium]|nr:restriction endonuclease subunit S [Gammaproteobacteria bacterium]